MDMDAVRWTYEDELAAEVLRGHFCWGGHDVMSMYMRVWGWKRGQEANVGVEVRMLSGSADHPSCRSGRIYTLSGTSDKTARTRLIRGPCDSAPGLRRSLGLQRSSSPLTMLASWDIAPGLGRCALYETLGGPPMSMYPAAA